MLTDVQLPEYLDAAATTPVHPEVLEAMLPYFTQHFGNANSQHIYGQIAKKAIEDARESIAAHINVLPEEIIFTSGATEAINLAIKGYWEANRDKGSHIITVKTEHKAVLNTCAYLETLGVDVTYLDVDHYGRITNDQLKAAFRPDTILACVMHVNNETGLIQDIHSFAETCAEQGIAFFTDSTQAIGHIETDYSNPAITMACMSAHKIQGPKGIGFMLKRKYSKVSPILHGGTQGLETGTIPNPLTIGLAKALDIQTTNYYSAPDIEQYLVFGTRTIPQTISAPHILHIKGIPNPDKSLFNFVISQGSACQSNLVQQSHVTKALGIPPNTSRRFSFFKL
jgi:cysteine desulfurase